MRHIALRARSILLAQNRPMSKDSSVDHAKRFCRTDVTRIGPVCSAMGLAGAQPRGRGPPPRRTVDQVCHRNRSANRRLKRVGCAVDMAGEVLQATAPNHRFDLSIEERFRRKSPGSMACADSRSRARLCQCCRSRRAKGSKPALKMRWRAWRGIKAINLVLLIRPGKPPVRHSNAPRLQNPIASQMAVMRSVSSVDTIQRQS